MSDCRFGVSPVNYPDPDPHLKFMKQTLYQLQDKLLQLKEWSTGFCTGVNLQQCIVCHLPKA